MYLKKLELSGFKSFARATTLEFPSRITAVVGPNGSGKSNIKEAIQWVLGEQSVKSLRGKRGEDLIWNGSPAIPRTGRALVSLTFDNSQGRIPIGFEEIFIMRKIFRDGLNEYYINGSPVRLRDVVELMAHIGLGETKHNIIGQGEVDRILLSNPRERREMLEEALGLRVYTLKKAEALRKLAATDTHIAHVESIVREIMPHLKFLRSQAQKAQARESLEQELKTLQSEYLAREGTALTREKKRIEQIKEPLLERTMHIKDQMRHIVSEIARMEQTLAAMQVKSDEEKRLMELESARRGLEREMGRLEGRLEVEREKLSQPHIRAVDMPYIKEEIHTLIAQCRSITRGEHDGEGMRGGVRDLAERLEKLLNTMERGKVEDIREEERHAIREWENRVHELHKNLVDIVASIEELEIVKRQARERALHTRNSIRSADASRYSLQEEEKDVAMQLTRISFEEERASAREEAWRRGFVEAGLEMDSLACIASDSDAVPLEELNHRIERLRAQLEEIGGIDPETIKEYREADTRHSFLAGELNDLKEASRSTRELIAALERHMRDDFKAGFSRINSEFDEYFRMIFGGGKALLHLVAPRPLHVRPVADIVRIDAPDEDVEEEEQEEGIDISVDLPRKRIKGLAMLSGGERALTSIALLFAITAVNPPPFLILDETDAALDEANTQRYVTIINELAKKTQLLIITHNRETMKSAGTLYGITMGGDGVSKLLSLKLEEAEQYTNRT